MTFAPRRPVGHLICLFICSSMPMDVRGMALAVGSALALRYGRCAEIKPPAILVERRHNPFVGTGLRHIPACLSNQSRNGTSTNKGRLLALFSAPDSTGRWDLRRPRWQGIGYFDVSKSSVPHHSFTARPRST